MSDTNKPRSAVPRVSPRGSVGHCGGCDAAWNALSVAHCATCHRTFTTVGAFDRHRRNGHCLDPDEIKQLVRKFRAGREVWGWAGAYDHRGAEPDADE